MIMQWTERGESRRNTQEDVSAGNGATSYIQSGITLDEAKAFLLLSRFLGGWRLQRGKKENEKSRQGW
jgi:hypothetical protein